MLYFCKLFIMVLILVVSILRWGLTLNSEEKQSLIQTMTAFIVIELLLITI